MSYNNKDGQYTRRSASLACALDLVSLFLVVAATVLVVMANFMPHVQSSTGYVEERIITQNVFPDGNLTYAKLYLSEVVIGVKSDVYKTELKFPYTTIQKFFYGLYNISTATETTLGNSMKTGFAFTIIGSVTGGMGTLLSILSLLASPMPWMDVTRIVLFILASISCLVALAVVAAVTKDQQFVDVSALLVQIGVPRLQLSVGFAFECVSFALYLSVTVIEIVLSCVCRDSPSCCDDYDRDAWQSDTQSVATASGANNQVTYVYQQS